MSEPEVLTRVQGSVGWISLNRPKAINALTVGMCRLMTEALLAWRDDPRVRTILLDHVGERGFCSGGDIRQIATQRDPALAVDFFGAEYRLNHLLHVYPKPVVAVMHGITMGGGVGISQPASVRVATERTLFAMPETGIGLFPDVGGGWYLPRLPGQVGAWLALTGSRLDGEGALATGLATHFVPQTDLDAFKADLLNAGDLAAVLSRFARPARPAALPHQDDIDRLFAADTVETVLANLEADGGEWAMRQLQELRRKSPFSLKVTLRQMRRGALALCFAEEMAAEYRMVLRVSAHPDFREGVRALLIDRDNTPAWSPSVIEDVTDDAVEAVWAPLPAGREWSPLPSLAQGERR
jgi:enoyl-CoA hydratase